MRQTLIKFFCIFFRIKKHKEGVAYNKIILDRGVKRLDIRRPAGAPPHVNQKEIIINQKGVTKKLS